MRPDGAGSHRRRWCHSASGFSSAGVPTKTKASERSGRPSRSSMRPPRRRGIVVEEDHEVGEDPQAIPGTGGVASVLIERTIERASSVFVGVTKTRSALRAAS